jgi:hypothetical protein
MPAPMRKSLGDPEVRGSLVTRLRTLSPDSTRQWGRMTPHQAVCHLSDSFRVMMNPVPITSKSSVFTRSVVRWIVLHTNVPLPRGTNTMPEVDQEIGGAKPVEFESDKRNLEA